MENNEQAVLLTQTEREFLISRLIKMPIPGVTLENIHNNKTVNEIVVLVQKLQGAPLKSDDGDDTIRDREE